MGCSTTDHAPLGTAGFIECEAQFAFRGATGVTAQVALPTRLYLVVSHCGQTQRIPNTVASYLVRCRDAGGATISAGTKTLPSYSRALHESHRRRHPAPILPGCDSRFHA